MPLLEINEREMATNLIAGNDNAGNSQRDLARIAQTQQITPPIFATKSDARKWDCQRDGNGVHPTSQAVIMSTCANGMLLITLPFPPLLAPMLLTALLRGNVIYENKSRR
jgi:hypothetical protein